VQLSLFAIGRMKSGPERELAMRYGERFEKAAPALGLTFHGVTEKVESAARDAAQRKREEAALLSAHLALTPGSLLVLLDETGVQMGSEEFAGFIAARRDAGARRMVLAIGGADGHDAELRAKAALILSFGRATWPHQLVRVMAAEQLYRAATILAGHPYHRA
jgi:23S rRNA (pseudouridine1915-N3)-methyltransferase